MDNARMLKIPGGVSIDTYEELKSQYDTLEGFIRGASLIRIKDLLDKEQKLATLEGKLEENKKRLDDINTQHQAELRRLKNLYDIKLDTEVKKYQADNRKNVNSKIKKPLEDKIKRAEDEALTWKQAYHNIMTELKKLNDTQVKILDIIESGGTVKDIKDVIINRMTTSEEWKLISAKLAEGLNNKEVAQWMINNGHWSCSVRTGENKVKSRRDKYEQ